MQPCNRSWVPIWQGKICEDASSLWCVSGSVSKLENRLWLNQEGLTLNFNLITTITARREVISHFERQPGQRITFSDDVTREPHVNRKTRLRNLSAVSVIFWCQQCQIDMSISIEWPVCTTPSKCKCDDRTSQRPKKPCDLVPEH